MTYTTLTDIFYKENTKTFQNTYQNRIDSLSTIQLPLSIISSYHHTYPLFVVVVPQIF
jgi:hypothetical protein